MSLTVVPDGVTSVTATMSRVRRVSRPRDNCIHRGELLPDEKFPPAKGAGDLAADAIQSLAGVFGIKDAKQWWAQATSAYAQDNPNGCSGCDGRQKKFNWFGKYLGLPEGQGPLLKKVLDAESIPQQRVYACAVHGKCLPVLRQEGEVLDAINQSGFHLCHKCTEKELVPLETEIKT